MCDIEGATLSDALHRASPNNNMADARRPAGRTIPVAAYKPLDAAVKEKVLKQLEFYFSDSNLPRDKCAPICVHENVFPVSFYRVFSRWCADA